MTRSTTTPTSEEEDEEPPVLVPIDVSKVPKTYEKPNITFIDPTNTINLTHDYITDDLNKYQIPISPCNNCCSAVKHFSEPKAEMDKIIRQHVTFTKNNESRLSDPSPDPGLPLYDPSRTRTKGKD